MRHLFTMCLFGTAWALSFGFAAAQTIEVSTADLPPRTLLRRPAPPPVPEWIKTHWRIGHLPGYNDRMVKEFLKAGYQAVIVNCLDTWDRVGPAAEMYSAEVVKRADAYLRRVVDTIHASKAKALFYLGPVQAPFHSPTLAKARLEWLRIGPSGKIDMPYNFGNVRSPYADWMRDQLVYLVKTYGVDGFWFDGYAPGHLHTYDPATRQLFRDFSGGKEIPPRNKLDPVGDPVTRQYLAWHEQHFIDLVTKVRQGMRQVNPDAVIFANHSGVRTWYYPEHYMGEYPLAFAGAVDVPSIELYWDVPGDALHQQFCFAFMQAVARERGASVWIQPSAHGITGVAAPIDIQLRGLEGLPWGVRPEFVESAHREEYLKLHADNIKAREPWLVDAEAVPYIGVVASEQTRTLYRKGALPMYFSHTLGAFRAVFEKHWPVRVLTEEDLEDAHLGGVRVLVLPNVACLSDRAAEVVRRFVHAGGGLVATFETSLYDHQFQRRKDFALADLFGAHYLKTHTVASRVDVLTLHLDSKHALTDDPLLKSRQATAWIGGDGPPPDKGNLSLIASAVEVEAKKEDIVATFHLGAAAKRNDRLPAVIARNVGKGRVVYLPAAADKAMFLFPDAVSRQLITNACRWAAGDQPPPLEVHGPMILAATFRRQPEHKRWIVHLLNDHSSYGRHSAIQKLPALPDELRKEWGFPINHELRGTWPVREEVIPLHDIKVICRAPGIRKATLQPEGRDLPLKRTGEDVEVIVPRLEMHALVVFE